MQDWQHINIWVNSSQTRRPTKKDICKILHTVWGFFFLFPLNLYNSLKGKQGVWFFWGNLRLNEVRGRKPSKWDKNSQLRMRNYAHHHSVKNIYSGLQKKIYCISLFLSTHIAQSRDMMVTLSHIRYSVFNHNTTKPDVIVPLGVQYYYVIES